MQNYDSTSDSFVTVLRAQTTVLQTVKSSRFSADGCSKNMLFVFWSRDATQKC